MVEWMVFSFWIRFSSSLLMVEHFATSRRMASTSFFYCGCRTREVCKSVKVKLAEVLELFDCFFQPVDFALPSRVMQAARRAVLLASLDVRPS